MLDDMGFNTVMLRDNRYDAVMHMVTAADGAAKFYDSETNAARYESVEEAVEKDKLLREAYMGHEKWLLIGNDSNGFDAKINHAKEKIHYILGHKTGSKFYKKFLLKTSQEMSFTTIPIKLPVKQNFEESQVIETFLKYPENNGANGRRIIESSIVRTGANRAFTYTHKILLETHGQQILKKRSISAAEYIEMESQRRTDIKPLISTRLCTIFEGLYMIIDWYLHVID